MTSPDRSHSSLSGDKDKQQTSVITETEHKTQDMENGTVVEKLVYQNLLLLHS